MCSNFYKFHSMIALLWFILNTPSSAVLFTAISELEYLLQTHKRVIADLESYVSMQEKKLSLLKGYLCIFTIQHKRAMEDTSSYLHNSINIFILIKRLTSDLEYLPTIIKTGTEITTHILSNDIDVVYPAEEDVVGAAQGIVRLQKTYNLHAKDLADGNLNNVTYVSPMTASDCYELSQALTIKSQDLKYGREWMMTAHQKYNAENISYPFTETDILKLIGIANIILGDTLNSSQKLIQSKIDSKAKEINKSITEEVVKLEKKIKEVKTLEEDTKEFSTYQALCRGEFDIPSEISKRLTCRYLTENHPFLRLAPFKMEMMYLNPDLVLFHDVMSDSEADTIKAQSRPKLVRAFINDPKTGYLTATHKRVGKVAWLSDNKSDIIARITRRVSHMTGLSLELTDKSQIVNYGIGGQYEPHYDFTTKAANLNLASANRIATVLFYLTDVAQGGATVFINLGVRLLPKRGTAVFWFNLHPSGQCDLAMKHASCPVLEGDKWVCSKFIHKEPQQFLKPCNLQYQEEGFIRKIPRPVLKVPAY